MSLVQPIVQTEHGELRGSIETDYKGKTYYSFKGIPYGKPPVDELRFKAPQPAEPWTGVRDATEEGSRCYSLNLLGHTVGSEDCLYINVHTPEYSTSNCPLKPVMVWIHGGSFTSGSGNADFTGPEFLITEDVVVVTFNYRLGIFGFINFEDPSLQIPGNAGLKDQVLALKWVQKNIKHFCGDPDNVTIFGNSAGGVSVHCLMLSPMARGLFHRAIVQSGVATSSWARGQRTAPLVAEPLGLNKINEKEIHSLLMGLTMEQLLELQQKIPDPMVIHKLRPFAPIIETIGTEPPFLCEDPVTLMKSGQFNQVPLMIGYNSREGILLLSEFEKWNADFQLVLPHQLQLPYDSPLSRTVSEKIKDFYYGEETPSYENIATFYRLQTDCVFFIGVHKVVRLQTESSYSPIYYYRLSLDTQLNLYKKFMGVEDAGTAHGDDIGYLFKTLNTPEIRPRSQEDIALRRVIKLWTTFARNGNPNPIVSDSTIPITWPRTEKGRLNFLDIGENLTVGVNPESERVELWDGIYALSNSKPKL